MSRYLFTLNGTVDRDRAARTIAAAPAGTRVEVKSAKRSLDQNSKLWAMLSEVAQRREHCGRKYTPDRWKAIFMHAWGREVEFIPSLDEKTFIPWNYSSSDLTKAEMSELIEFIVAWGAENGFTFSNEAEAA